MAQIFKCDLCGSLDGKNGLGVRVGLIGSPFGSYPPPSQTYEMLTFEANDLCCACAETLIGYAKGLKR
jgi:hypothetical protein